MDQQQLAIIQKATSLFFRYGVRSVSMDDLSRELGISKKTLYQVIGNKDSLVHECVVFGQDAEEQLMEQVSAAAKDAIDEIFQASQYHLEQLRNLTPTLLYDLRKYYPKSWKIIQHSTQTAHVRVIVANLKRGIAEGYYRPDMEPEVIARLFAKMQLALVEDNEAFGKFANTTIDLHVEAFRYHLRGICTPAGLERWQEYQAKHQLNSTPTI